MGSPATAGGRIGMHCGVKSGRTKGRVRVPKHVPHFADAKHDRARRAIGTWMKSGGSGGSDLGGIYWGRTSLLKKCKPCGVIRTSSRPSKVSWPDETAILGILPDGKPGAGRTPNINHFLVGIGRVSLPMKQVQQSARQQSCPPIVFVNPFSLISLVHTRPRVLMSCIKVSWEEFPGLRTAERSSGHKPFPPPRMTPCLRLSF